MILAILLLLTASISAAITWYARDIWNKLTYLYYTVKTREQSPAIVQPNKVPREQSVARALTEPGTLVVRRLTPKQLRNKKAQDFRAKY